MEQTSHHRPITFHKILIANRGEIALRVMRSAREMGYSTVAVYSTADARARHVQAADEAVCIGQAAPVESYLNVAAILQAAQLSGADAVHPGYGFLAENDAFAQACVDAGLVFIGPTPAAMRAMGDKAGAKALMLAAGVPCIPGYHGADQSEARLAAEAVHIGWPVMIKATAGGGGRGMRQVASADGFLAALRSARSEALSAFGDDTVLLERAVARPRHIEIQVFADMHGQVLHLGERDCSVQRRHQKLIEEAPSPAVTPELRERMGAVAVAAAKAIGYVGAGTLEFLLDESGQFYFMEMNTRLQVEHAVTEAITGLDLVAWQLRVAAGEPLPLRQDQVRWRGHAIEVRLCAEDAHQHFMPQSGRLLRWEMPDRAEQGGGALRVDHALRSGDEIAPHYDSMVAKLVAWGADRDEALRKLRHGLRHTVALGVVTNQAFLGRALAHPVFTAGQATTAFVGEQASALLADPQTHARDQAAALAAALLNHGPHRGHGLPVLLNLSLDGQAYKGHLQQRDADVAAVTWAEAEATFEVSLWIQDAEAKADVSSGQGRATIHGLSQPVRWVRDGACLWLHWAGRNWRAEDLGQQPAAAPTSAQGDGRVRAAMNGRVVTVHVAAGEAVVAGQALITLEAMKMEHHHTAPHAGVVKLLNASVGAQVAAKQVLLEIELAAIAAG